MHMGTGWFRAAVVDQPNERCAKAFARSFAVTDTEAPEVDGWVRRCANSASGARKAGANARR